MLDTILARLHQGRRTMAYPAGPAVLPDRFRGYPLLDRGRCGDNCRSCADACPYGAIETMADDKGQDEGNGVTSKRLMLDMGKCLFCGDCSRTCPAGALSFSNDHRLAVSSREDLVLREGGEHCLARALEGEMLRLFGRSLKLREVSAAGCNACEADTNVLNTIGFDLSRFGIQFVASPRHADGIYVTGPVSVNMREALLKTWEAIPGPKIVIAAGACAINGGPFKDSPQVCNGVDRLLPVDLYIPGCPPHPLTILDGLLRLLGKL